ncbi:MAG: ribosome small subunit-dependent GTPase A [Bacillota bacterium]
MQEGIILKGYSGFYYVSQGEKVYECSLRGKNRIKNVKFLPGDKVRFTPLTDKSGVIEEVLPRTNELIRPPIANVEQVLIVASLFSPEPDLWLLDRMTVLALWNDINPIICFTKGDLVPLNQSQQLIETYEKAKIEVIVTSTKTGWGIEKIKRALQNKISVLAGPSGVGKSSLLNSIQPGLKLQTGNVSEKLKRGKHTTRHVELLTLEGGGLVADTPGFSSLNLPSEIIREELSFLFPDFDEYRGDCKFTTCLHKREPGCCVRAAAEAGQINRQRYENYLLFLEEVIQQERSF